MEHLCIENIKPKCVSETEIKPTLKFGGGSTMVQGNEYCKTTFTRNKGKTVFGYDNEMKYTSLLAKDWLLRNDNII